MGTNGYMSHDASPLAPPAGFQLLEPLDALMSALSPVYAQICDDGSIALGFRIEAHHCNPGAACHGGTWATMADVLMGINVGQLTGLSGPTISLNVNFAAAGLVGEWAAGHARVLGHSPRLAFANCVFTADGKAAVSAHAVFRRAVPPIRDFAAQILRGPNHGQA